MIQKATENRFPSKTIVLVRSVPWVVPEFRRTIRRRNKTLRQQTRLTVASLKLNSMKSDKKLEQVKKKVNDLYVNNLLDDMKIYF